MSDSKANDESRDDARQTCHGVRLFPDDTIRRLDDKQLVQYRSERKRFIEWCYNVGKNPEDAVGYAQNTTEVRAYRTNAFYEWVWDVDGFTLDVTHSHADDYMDELAYGDLSQDHKANTQKAIKTLFEWLADTRGGTAWDPRRTFSNSSSTTIKRDYLTRDERQQLREAALEYSSIPHYNSVTVEQRAQWKRYLAKSFGVPVDEVGLDHWEEATSWKVPSLVCVSLDTGLRPIEVERATVEWVDLHNEVLRVPKDASRKDDVEWDSALTSRTVDVLERWLDQRGHMTKYDDTDALWLTRRGNPYGSHALSHLMDNLAVGAGIEHAGRDLTWYSIRRGLGTAIIDEADLSTAQEQLRHLDPKTTMRYDQRPAERRRETLDRLG